MKKEKKCLQGAVRLSFSLNLTLPNVKSLDALNTDKGHQVKGKNNSPSCFLFKQRFYNEKPGLPLVWLK